MNTDEIDKMLGMAVYSFVKAGIAAGLTPTRSMALAGFGIIEGTLGRDIVRELGLPSATASDWRREIAAMAEQSREVLEDREFELKMINEMLPALGLRDLRMVREEGQDNG